MNIPVASGNITEQFARTLMTSLDLRRDDPRSADEFTSYLTALAGEELGTDSPTHPATHDGPAPRMIGFDFATLSDPSHATVKYQFGRVAQRYSLASVRDHASAESLLLQMRPDLEAAGIAVLDVSQDKIQVRDDHGRAGWIGVIGGAGGIDPAFQWRTLPAGNDGLILPDDR